MQKLTLLSLVLFLSVPAYGQSSWSPEQKEVQETVIQFFDALSQRDSIRLRQLSASDLVLFEYGLTWTIDTLIQKAITLNTAPDFRRENSFQFINTTVNGSTAWAAYTLHSAMTKNGNHTTADWLETIIAVKERRKWKIKVLHSSLLKRT